MKAIYFHLVTGGEFPPLLPLLLNLLLTLPLPFLRIR